MPGKTLPVLDLHKDIPRIFDQAQTTVANHQKNYVALYKLHTNAGRTENLDELYAREREFEQVFFPLMALVLPVKKGNPAADRLVKFIGGYIKFINDRAAEDKIEDDDDAEDTDTTASRFTAKLLGHLQRGFQAKDKNVRYRVVHIVAEVVGFLGELDVDIFTKLQTALLDRIYDKEATIRLQVVMALSKIAGAEDADDIDEDEQSLMQVLIDTMTTDPAADVRRAALCNIPVRDISLPAILARGRDVETSIRKLLYSKVLQEAAPIPWESLGSAHPTGLTIEQREQIVQNGLGDRESTVRTAASSLIGTWFDILEKSDVKTEEDIATRLNDVDLSNPEEKPQLTPEEVQQKLIATLTKFLTMFDLYEVSLDKEGKLQPGKVAYDALAGLFVARPKILKELFFGDAYFNQLTPEKMFLARAVVDQNIDDDQQIESVGIPVVTHCAYLVQDSYNALCAAEDEKEDAKDNATWDEDKEDARLAKEFITGEMLALCVHLDYGDEIGRRKMFALIRDMLREIPLSLIPRCLDVMRRLWPSERDLILVVVEVIQDLREPGDAEEDVAGASQTQDSIDPDASFSSDINAAPKNLKPPKAREDMTAEERRSADMIDLRCLALCIGMLERLDSTLEENSTLQGIMRDLVVPSIGRKDDVKIREQGLIALGLMCLVNKDGGRNMLPMFLSQLKAQVTESARISILQIIIDLLMVNDNSQKLFADAEQREKTENLLNYLLEQLLDHENTSAKVVALLGLGLAKLLKFGMVGGLDDKIAETLLVAYFSPYNRENQALKQPLTFFFRVHFLSMASQQQVLRQAFVPVFMKVAELYADYEGDDVDALDITHVTKMFLHLTDPSQLMDPKGDPGETGSSEDSLVQFELAEDIIRALLTKDLTKENKKALCQMFAGLNIPDEVDVDKIRTLKLLIYTLNLRRPLKDATAKNAVKKFDTSISKKFEEQLQDFSEEEYRQLESLKQLFEFLDEIIPDDDDDNEVSANKKKGRKRRSDSIVSTTTEGDTASVASSRRGRSKPKAKRRRLSTSDDSDSDSDDGTAKGTPPPPTRTLPKRSAAAKKTKVIEISSDDEEDEDESDHEATPAARKVRGRVASTRNRKREDEARLDAEIDDLLDEGPSAQAPNDSIMDDSDEEEEDEVNDLLVGE